MKLDILAAFNTNSRCLIRILRSWGLVGARNRKQGAEQVVAGVGKIRKNMKIGKTLENGLGVGGGAPDGGGEGGGANVEQVSGQNKNNQT